MTKPVSYIAEGPTFSAGDIALALLILAAALAAFIFVMVVGVKGFHRLGRGQHSSIAAKIAPLVGLLDVLLLVNGFDEALLLASAPFCLHAGAFALGYRARRSDPPPPPPGP